MNRRSLIATVGAATALTAGCLSQARGSDSGGADTPSHGSDSTTDGSDSTADGSGSNSSDSTPPVDGDTRFADIECPSFTEADRTVCYHTLSGETPDIYVAPSTELFEPTPDDDTVEPVEFVLHNGADAPFGMNPYAWSIYERTDDDWSFLAPDAHVEPWTELPSGESYTWRLSRQQHSGPMSEDTMAIVEDLADGIYAFQITGFTGNSDDRTRIECIALFDVATRSDDQ